MLKAKEVRELGIDEIRQRIRDEEEQLRQLHFQHAIAHIENPMVLREKRRLIARLRTILKQKESAA
jgi:large subunit ribosomal protein L29